MYKIFADETLIYDSTLEDYKIGKGSISLETNKSGSFTFSVYPDHFYYDNFVRLKTVITVYKSGKIVFRGRILNDVTDYWNNKNITCEGELGFLQDSIIRPFSFTGTPEDLFKKFIEEHNSQVDEFKKFKVGTVTVVDPNNYIARSNSAYESSLSNLNSRLIEDSLGGYFYITHGDNGTDPIPTINYLADFTKVSSQKIEFGSNLKSYTKTVKASDIATAIIPLGHGVDDGDDNTENPKLTIASVNGGKDYVYSEEGVALYGWIFKTVSFDDVTDASNLKTKGENYLNNIVQQNITIELNAIDLHLIDRSIESFSVCDYIRVISTPHNFDSTLLCSKQTIDLLKPENDTLTLGYTYSTFTKMSNKIFSSVTSIVNVQSAVNNLSNRFSAINQTVINAEKITNTVSGDLEKIAGVVVENARNIAINAGNISNNAKAIADLNKKELNILVLGNSFSQDSFAYLPPVLNEILPDYNITYGVAYKGGTALKDQADTLIPNNQYYHSFNYWDISSTSWTRYLDGNYYGDKYADENGVNNPTTFYDIMAMKKWDIIYLQPDGMLRDGDPGSYVVSSTNVNYSIVTPGRYVLRKLQELNGGTFSLLLGQRLGTDKESTIILAEGMGLAKKRLGFIDYAPIGTAIQIARTNPTLKALGKDIDKTGYGMLYDSHMQAGIPALLATYTVALKILELIGELHRGIYGSTFEPTTENCIAVGAYAENGMSATIKPMTHGESMGVTSENIKLAQECAYLAFNNPTEISDGIISD